MTGSSSSALLDEAVEDGITVFEVGMASPALMAQPHDDASKEQIPPHGHSCQVGSPEPIDPPTTFGVTAPALADE